MRTGEKVKQIRLRGGGVCAQGAAIPAYTEGSERLMTEAWIAESVGGGSAAIAPRSPQEREGKCAAVAHGDSGSF